MFLERADCYLVVMAKLAPRTDARALCLMALARESISQKQQTSKKKKKPATSE